MRDRHDLLPGPTPSLSGAAQQEPGTRRIAVISASVGAGHDGAAAGLTDRLTA
ncbi:hypothetical protein ACWEO4_24820 [Streptomyces sp. NPDC004393]|uniref:hypothetical protein n=1 Tax=Streptomyces sp. NPDC004533 TaxID=3154278 RepID=UPI0033A68DD6